MPHPHYTDMIAEILNNKIFIEDYEFYTETELNTYMGIAIYKKSKYYKEMKEIIDKKCSKKSALKNR